MALSVPQQWTGAAGHADAGVATIPTPGNWLIACIGVHVVDGSAPSISVGDPSRNIWHLLHSETVTAHASHDAAQLQLQVWACPAAAFDGWDQLTVQVAAQAISAFDAGSVLIHVAEIAGMVNGYLTVDSVTIATATAAGSLSIPVPAPAGGANCLVVAAAAIDDTTKTINAPSGSYTDLTHIAIGPPDVEMAPAWRAATGATTPSWALASGTANWVGVAVAIRETGVGPVQPNPNWPALRLELGLGYDADTPLTAVRWTDQTDRLVDRNGNATVYAPRGIPYTLGKAQSEPIDLALRNDDGALTPREPGSATANAGGTTSIIKVPDAQADNIQVSDFFHLRDSGGELKELAVFQVTALVSTAGTTWVAFERADGTGFALAATASGDQYEGIAVDLLIPFRVTMAWDGKTYPVTAGSLGDLPQTWETSAWGRVNAGGIDVLGTLTTAVPTALAGEYLRRNPTRYWPLSDPSGSTGAVDVTGNGDALVMTPSKYGVGADARAEFGVSTQSVDVGTTNLASMIGDPGTGWSQTGLTAAEVPKQGYALVGRGDDFPPITDGVTIVGWLLRQNTADGDAVLNSTVDPTVCIIRNTDPGAGFTGTVIKLSVDEVASFASVTTWNATTHTSTEVVATDNPLLVSVWRSWALTFNRTEWHCYVGGEEVLSGSANLAAAFSLISIGGEADAYGHGRFTPALNTHIGMFDRMLTAQEIVAIDDCGSLGRMSLDTKSRMVTRKLNTVGWKGPRIVSASDVGPSPESTEGDTIAEYTASQAADDDGLQFADAAGQLQWRGHVVGYYQHVRATLGEDTANGEIPYLPGVKYDYDPTYLYNDVRVENSAIDGWSNPIDSIHTATDLASKAKYGPRSMSMSTRLRFAEDPWSLAQALLSRYNRPRLRVGGVVIDPASNPDAWEFCLSVEVGDLVTVNRRPMGAPMISQTCRVLRVVPDLGPGRATFALELEAAPAPAPVIILGDPVMGAVDGRTIGW